MGSRLFISSLMGSFTQSPSHAGREPNAGCSKQQMQLPGHHIKNTRDLDASLPCTPPAAPCLQGYRPGSSPPEQGPSGMQLVSGGPRRLLRGLPTHAPLMKSPRRSLTLGWALRNFSRASPAPLGLLLMGLLQGLEQYTGHQTPGRAGPGPAVLVVWCHGAPRPGQLHCPAWGGWAGGSLGACSHCGQNQGCRGQSPA